MATPSPLHPLCVATRKVRTEFGESQDQFARRLDVAMMTISHWERGVTVPSRADSLQKLADSAEAVELLAEADQFRAAYAQAAGIKTVKTPSARGQNQDRGKDLLTINEISSRSGIGLNSVYTLVRQRKIPSIRIGRDILIPRPQYERWLETVKGSFDGPVRKYKKPFTTQRRRAAKKRVA